ncbi:hypothetical protein Tco_1056015 [Tanacetum coccineum]|uniref:Uncharacterized protein n=1 Tax=Tanacetum coccineum TaxID=301880 RepID=A0ABQ5H1B4_9ASTR
MDSVKPRILAPGRYAIDVEPIPPRNRNNREVHLDYLKHLKKSVETLREIVKEAKVERPLDSSLAFSFLYTKHSQEPLEYVIGTCPKDFNQRDKNHVATPLTRKKQVTFEDQYETSNILREVSTFLFLVFDEVLRLLLVVSSSYADSDGGEGGLKISLPLFLVVDDECA